MCVHLSGYFTEAGDIIHFPGLTHHEDIYRRWIEVNQDDRALLRLKLFGRTPGMDDPRLKLLPWEIPLPKRHVDLGSAAELSYPVHGWDGWTYDALVMEGPWAIEHHSNFDRVAERIIAFHERLMAGGLDEYALKHGLEPDSTFHKCLVPEAHALLNARVSTWFELWEDPGARCEKWRIPA